MAPLYFCNNFVYYQQTVGLIICGTYYIHYRKFATGNVQLAYLTRFV